MSEGSWLPRTWGEAVPQVIWAVLVLGFGLEFCVSLLNADYGRALLAVVGLGGLLFMLIHAEQLRKQLLTVNPNLVFIAFALFLASIVLSSFVEEKRWPLSVWFPPGATLYQLVSSLTVIAVIGLGLLFFSMLLVVVQVVRQRPQIMSVRHPSAYLKDIHIYASSGGVTPLNPRFVARFARNGQRVRLYAEDRYYPAALMSPGLIHSPMVLLAEIKDFVVGQSIDIAIMTSFVNDGREMWRWGPPTEKPDPKTTFQSHASHRGRLVLLADDGAPEYFYFIIDQAAWDTPPNVIGQERFEFIQKWESENEQPK